MSTKTTEPPVKVAPVVETPLSNKQEEKTEQPPLYAVVLLNDDTTLPGVVADVLSEVFRKASQDAWQLMMLAHRQGRSTVGTYTKGIGETLIENAVKLSHQLSEAKGWRSELHFALEAA